jgi:hypothetical protein
MHHLKHFSATATTEVLVVHPEVLALHEQHPHATVEQVAYWWNRFSGNLKKAAGLLELGKSRPTAIMLPGAHSRLAFDRPQGGSSVSWMEVMGDEFESADGGGKFEQDRRSKKTVNHALTSTRQRLGKKINVLGDTARLFSFVIDPEWEAMANNS